jgi:hypothetical protein
MKDFRVKSVRLYELRPLCCYNCGEKETEWIPKYYSVSKVPHETWLLCKQCNHIEKMKQNVFDRLFIQWLDIKLKMFCHLNNKN